jgi:hypothetical protein
LIVIQDIVHSPALIIFYQTGANDHERPHNDAGETGGRDLQQIGHGQIKKRLKMIDSRGVIFGERGEGGFQKDYQSLST